MVCATDLPVRKAWSFAGRRLVLESIGEAPLLALLFGSHEFSTGFSALRTGGAGLPAGYIAKMALVGRAIESAYGICMLNLHVFIACGFG